LNFSKEFSEKSEEKGIFVFKWLKKYVNTDSLEKRGGFEEGNCF